MCFNLWLCYSIGRIDFGLVLFKNECDVVVSNKPKVNFNLSLQNMLVVRDMFQGGLY